MSSLVMLFVGELVARALFSEVDYLRPAMVSHDQLRYSIKPHSSGHDAWGFRNRTVPKQADIVAIGDSLTYGLAAIASESWPAWLASLSGYKVYNLALGGYGPKDYSWLLQNKAHLLKPKQVYIAIYLGNDLYREKNRVKPKRVTKNGEVARTDQKWGVQQREFLSRNSMLYQITKLNFSKLANWIRALEENRSSNGLILLETKNLNTILNPQRLLKSPQNETLNQSSRLLSSVNDAFTELQAMMTKCDQQPYDCTFILLPTKESVYGEIAATVLDKTSMSRLEGQLRFEDLIRKATSKLLSNRGYPPIDALNALKLAANDHEIYPSSDDGHPNGLGYKIIAELINQRITDDISIKK